MANSSCVAASTTAAVAAVSSPLKTPSRNPKPQSIRFLLSLFSSNISKMLAAGTTATRAVYSNPFWIPQPNQRTGIWSIREDLQMPSSPYFQVEAQGGQGPPPMVQERFQSVISHSSSIG